VARRHVFALGEHFPHEGFVQNALERHFASLGFEIVEGGDADLVCVHPQTQKKWVVEAKGATSAIGLDFRTGLGQLICRMSTPSSDYAVAVPDLPQFLIQCRRIRPWVRQALRLHWLLVAQDGSVKTVKPEEVP
jgi:hypothetical protein